MNSITEILSNRCQLLAMTFAIEGTSYVSSSIMDTPDYIDLITDYFMEADSDKIQDALDEFDGDYDDEELRLMRIKFINEVAN